MTGTIRIAVVFVLTLVVAGFVAESGFASQTEKEIGDFLQHRLDALSNKDMNALMDTLAPDDDVLMIGNSHDERWVGREQIKEVFAKQISEFESETSKLIWRSIGYKGDIAWFSGAVLVNMQTKDGSAELKLNWSGVMEKRDGKWMLLQSHFPSRFRILK